MRRESLLIFLFLVFLCSFLPQRILALSLSLESGWNLISPGEEKISFEKLKNANPQCRIYEKAFWWNGKAWENPEILEPMKGYWIFAQKKCKIEISGEKSFDFVSFLHPRWNLISTLSGMSFLEMNKGNSCKPYFKWLFWYNPKKKKYEFVSLNEKLDPNKGYFVWVFTECELRESSIYIFNIFVPEKIKAGEKAKISFEVCDQEPGWELRIDFGDGSDYHYQSERKCKFFSFSHLYTQKQGSADIRVAVRNQKGQGAGFLRSIFIERERVKKGELEVKFAKDIVVDLINKSTNSQKINNLLRAYQVTEILPLFKTASPGSPLARWYLLKGNFGKTSEEIKKAAKIFENVKGVTKASPTYLPFFEKESSWLPNDPYFPQQENLKRIQLPKAWTITKGRPEIVIAVIDSGVDINHPDLKDNIWTNPGEIPNNGKDDDNNGYIDDIHGWNFAQNNNDLSEESCVEKKGHGTMVAGIIAAKTNNGEGIAGVCPNCKIMALKGGCYLASVAKAIKYAVDNGAKIINMSWVFHKPIPSLYDAIVYAYKRGVILVAAGRTGLWLLSGGHYPSDWPEVISVGTTDKDDLRDPLFGVDISAPDENKDGTKLWTTYPTNLGPPYVGFSGASAATPQISGTIGLMLSLNPNLTQEQIKSYLRNNGEKEVRKGFCIFPPWVGPFSKACWFPFTWKVKFERPLPPRVNVWRTLTALGGMAQPPPDGVIPLKAGINHISVNVKTNVTDIGDDCSITYGPNEFDSKTKKAKKVNILEPLKGYEIGVQSTCEAEIHGSQGAKSIFLYPGWNFISTKTSKSWQELEKGCELEDEYLYYYPPYQGELSEPEKITPDTPLNKYRGYWVKVKNECKIEE